MAENIDHRYWAEKTLQYLISHIRDYKGGNKFVYYGELAEAIGYPEPYKGSVFGLRIGQTLGELGHMIESMVIDGEHPPYIQALVVKKGDKLPGDGLKEFYEDYPDLPRDKKKDLIAAEYERVFNFGSRWEKLLEELGLSTDKTSAKEKDRKANPLHNPYGSEGSPEHQKLRNHVYQNPQLLGISPIARFREYPLKSGDFIDVVFETPTEIIGVEVKSYRSGHDDLERGVFQCIKYRAVLEAERTVASSSKKIECILITEPELPRHLRSVTKKLGVRFLDNFSPETT